MNAALVKLLIQVTGAGTLLAAALAQQRSGPTVPQATAPAVTAVPDALAEFVIEAAKATDYDHLLHADGGAHE